MKKVSILLSAGMALLMSAGAAQQTQAPTPVTATDTVHSKASTSDTSKSAPTQATMATKKYQARPMAFLDAPRYISKPGPRRVKYGKSRWIVLA